MDSRTVQGAEFILLYCQLREQIAQVVQPTGRQRVMPGYIHARVWHDGRAFWGPPRWWAEGDVRAAPAEDDPRLLRALAAIGNIGKDRHHTWSLWKDNRSVCLREGCRLEVIRLPATSSAFRASYQYNRDGVELASGPFGIRVPPCTCAGAPAITRENLERQLAELKMKRAGLDQQIAKVEQQLRAWPQPAPEAA